jgi:hypothetical protein
VQVIAENLSEDEIAGLREMFKMIDTDNSGQITFEELKVGLKKFGANLNESEIYDLMQAVSICSESCIFISLTIVESSYNYIRNITNPTWCDTFGRKSSPLNITNPLLILI